MVMKTTRVPRWFWTVTVAAASLWLIVTLYYWLGASGVSASGAKISFDRKHDISLFKVDDTQALSVDKYGVGLVKYKRGMFPFCPLCGMNESSGTIMNGVRYRKGDWIYTDIAQPFKEAVNLKTGETVDLPDGSGTLAQPPADFVARGLDFAQGNAIDPESVSTSFVRLPTINESCVTFNAAFIIVFGVLLLIGGVFALRRPK
ncbi:MAG: hypothetical protein PHU25_01565 [Deltaproteobacteria bacterium]|nr:hypothetical protein [Deltaproteobacteria bacterium]